MTNEEKAMELCKLVFNKTMPNDQFGFYTEQDMYNDILRILNS